MRLSFPQGVHPDVTVQPGEWSIGSASDNRVVLKADGIQPHHAQIVVDPRGYTLFVKSPDAQTHVNARPVREKAILRLGDVVSLNAINVVLKPDYDETVSANRPGAANGAEPTVQTPPKVVLRGVSGPYFGKVVHVQGRLTIGTGPDCDLVLDEPAMAEKHATIEVIGSEILMRDHGSDDGCWVNGVAVKDAQLFTGDQIAFDSNRFLIEAPGMPVRKPEVKPEGAAAPAAPPEPKRPVEFTQTMRAIPQQGQAAPATPPAARPQPQSSPQAAAQGASARTPALKAPSRSPQPQPAKGFNPWWLLVAAAVIAAAIAFAMIGSR